MRIHTDFSQVGKAQGDPAVSMAPAGYPRSYRVQVTVQPAASAGSTAGTLAMKFKAAGGNNDESLLDAYGAAVVISVAASTSVTRYFDVVADKISATPSGLNGKYDMIVNWFLCDQ